MRARSSDCFASSKHVELHFMKELTDARWIKWKGILFLAVGMLSAILLLLETPTLKTALLLTIAIWCFCRFYYFAFYVIERYVDPGFRFSGLWMFARYLFQTRKAEPKQKQNQR